MIISVLKEPMHSHNLFLFAVRLPSAVLLHGLNKCTGQYGVCCSEVISLT